MVNYSAAPPLTPGRRTDINKSTENKLYILMDLMTCDINAGSCTTSLTKLASTFFKFSLTLSLLSNGKDFFKPAIYIYQRMVQEEET